MTDIILDENNDITFLNNDFNLFEEDDNNLIAQRIEIKLRSYKGEWFRDINYGIPWISILSRNGNKNIADNNIKKTILQDEDIKSISKYSSVVRSATLKVTFTAKLKAGGSTTINLEL